MTSNPVLVELLRGDHVESIHAGAYCIVKGILSIGFCFCPVISFVARARDFESERRREEENLPSIRVQSVASAGLL
jgi:hypothetical protein